MSWLDDYVTYASRLTDAPKVFQIAGGLNCLSVAVGNSVFFRAWGSEYYPTLWTMLVSPSGWYRKSTCINLASDMMRSSGFAERLLPARTTYEKLISALSENATRLLTFGEFGGFIADLDRNYNAGAKEDLTEMFDGCQEFVRQSMGGGTIRINKPAVNLFGASVIDWMSDKIKLGDLRGGFLSRFLLFTATSKENNFGRVEIDNTATRQKNSLVERLSRIRHLQGEMDFSNIRNEEEIWVKSFEKIPVNSNLWGLASRMHTYILKFTLLLAVSEGTLIARPDHFQWAQLFAMKLYKDTVEVFAEDLSDNRFQVNLNNIKKLAVTAENGITRKDIAKELRLPIREIDSALETLLTAEVFREEVIKNSHGKPTILFRFNGEIR